MTRTAFDGAKVAHGGGRHDHGRERTTVTLSCGCETRRAPKLSNPDKWWCCGTWQTVKR